MKLEDILKAKDISDKISNIEILQRLASDDCCFIELKIKSHGRFEKDVTRYVDKDLVINSIVKNIEKELEHLKQQLVKMGVDYER